MPFKWRFFRFTNYFHIGLVSLLTFFLIVGWASQESEPELWTYLLASLAPPLLITNAVNNLILLGKYYPEKLPGKQFSTYVKILFGVSIAPFAFVGLITGFVINDECIQPLVEDRPVEFSGLTTAFLFILAFLTGFHALWYQVVLRKTIRRNFDLGIDQFLTDENP